MGPDFFFFFLHVGRSKGEKNLFATKLKFGFISFAQRLVEAAEEAHHEHEENPDLQVRLRLLGVKKKRRKKTNNEERSVLKMWCVIGLDPG